MSGYIITRPEKVLFLEPIGTKYNVFSKFMTIPMLGPVYLATIARNAGFDTEIINENIIGRKISEDELISADILCLSCMTSNVNRGKEVAKEYKQLRQKAGLDSKTIIGGIHASMIPEDVTGDFDQVFVGEGETKIVSLLSGLYNGEKIVYGEKPTELDFLPYPDFTLMKDWEKMKILPVMSSRGCPFDCSFCSAKMFGRKYRMKSPETVVDEIMASGREHLFFTDDHFAANTERTKKICEKIIEKNLKLRWSCQVRVEISNKPELLKLMKKAGCRTVYVGFESINPQSLEEMKKKQTVDDVKNAIKAFHNNGISVHGMFILGSDSDRKDTFKQTSRFCIKSNMKTVQYMILTPLPGTRFYREIENSGRLLHKKWDYYDTMHVVFRPLKFSPAELQKGMLKCFKAFYSRTRGTAVFIKTLFLTIGTFIGRIFRKIPYPSFLPAIWKFAGSYMVNKFININYEYFRYLKKLKKAPVRSL
jgi:radical SAM superfamily enzyme YgiQ (UPF0313 family)